jgi:hypothetical protein
MLCTTGEVGKGAARLPLEGSTGVLLYRTIVCSLVLVRLANCVASAAFCKDGNSGTTNGCSSLPATASAPLARPSLAPAACSDRDAKPRRRAARRCTASTALSQHAALVGLRRRRRRLLLRGGRMGARVITEVKRARNERATLGGAGLAGEGEGGSDLSGMLWERRRFL